MNVKDKIASIVLLNKAIPSKNIPVDTVEPGEILSERTPTAKVFNLGGNKRRAKIYACPIHFKDIDGSFKSIDPTVKRKPLTDPLQTHKYEVKSGLYHAHFKADKPHDYRLEIGDSWIQYEAQFVESDVLTIKVETSRIGVKETITLLDKTAPTKLSWKVTREGTGIVTPDPTVKDAKGKEVPVKVTQDKDTLTYEIDTTDAVFPIEIDPTSITATNYGWIRKEGGTSFDTQRDATSGGATTGAWNIVGLNVTGGNYWYVDRSFFSFVLPDMVAVTAAEIYLDGGDNYSTYDFNINIFTATHTTPVNDDFNNFDGWQASGAYNGTILNDTWSSATWDSGWNHIHFNAAGLAALLVKKNDTFKCALLHDLDVSDTPPSGSSSIYFGYGTGKEPYLSITYSAYRNMTGTSNIAVTASSEMYAERAFTGTSDIALSTTALSYADRNPAGQADIALDASLLFSRTFEMAGGQADMVFDALGSLALGRAMAGQADISIDRLGGWKYRKIITIDKTAAGATAMDIVDCVLLTDANFDFSLARSDGFDIRFTSSDGNTLLKYERTSYDSVGETSELHIKVPIPNGAVDTVYYMYYGNASAADGADGEAVWDDKMVQHMDDATTSTITDSTQYHNDGVKKGANEPIEDVGQIGKAQLYDGSDDKITITDVASLDLGTSDFTFAAWINFSVIDHFYTVINKGHYSQNDEGYHIAIDDYNKLQFVMGDGVSEINNYGNPRVHTLSINQWYHVALVLDRSGNAATYVNGVLDDEKDISAYVATDISNAVDLLIGMREDGSLPIHGLIDEVRISNIARSAAWIKAEYNAGNGTLHTMVDDSGFTGNIMMAMYADRNMKSTANIVLDTLCVMYAIRQMTGTSDVVLDAQLLMYTIHYISGQADIVLTPYMYMGLEGSSGLITRY